MFDCDSPVSAATLSRREQGGKEGARSKEARRLMETYGEERHTELARSGGDPGQYMRAVVDCLANDFRKVRL